MDVLIKSLNDESFRIKKIPHFIWKYYSSLYSITLIKGAIRK